MKNIAALLIEFGQDFDYQNFYSHGERLYCSTMDVTVTTSVGRIKLESPSYDTTIFEDEQGWDMIASRIEELLIKHTT